MMRATPSRSACALLLLYVQACSSKTPEEQPDEPAPTKVVAPEPVKAAPSSAVSNAQSETVDGYRLIRARTKDGGTAAIEVKAPPGWQVMQAPSADPHAGKFTLAEAQKGLAAKGTLAAHIKTSLGSFYCDLFADKAPNTVANFVGLARGLRKYWDTDKVEWVARPYYNGTTFHRVVPGFMIQGGDRTGTGAGIVGYVIPDENHPSLFHNAPGQLCMANRGPNTGADQFFITEGAAPHLDGGYTIFGQCEPATLVQRIARVPQSGSPKNMPLTPVVIEKVEIKRVTGGIAKWMPASAKLPPLKGLPAPGRAVHVP